MNWSNLKRNKCPKCSGELEPSQKELYLVCDCGFKVSYKRFQEITSDMVQRKVDRDFVDKEIDEYERNKI